MARNKVEIIRWELAPRNVYFELDGKEYILNTQEWKMEGSVDDLQSVTIKGYMKPLYKPEFFKKVQ